MRRQRILNLQIFSPVFESRVSTVVVAKPSLEGGQWFSLLNHHDHVVELVCSVFRKAHSLDLKSELAESPVFCFLSFLSSYLPFGNNGCKA